MRLQGFFILLFFSTGTLIAGDSDTAGAIPQDTRSELPVSSSADTGTSSDTTDKKKRDLTDTVHYEADCIDYDAETKKLMLTGNSRLDYQDLTLYADTILYLIDKNIFTATGFPQLIEGTDTTVGDYMVYNIKTRRGRVNHASTHLVDAYFNGNRIMKSRENELYVDAGDYTTCAHVDTPHYCFYGRKIKIVPNDKIISKPVVLNIGDAPVAALPYFIFPIERKRRSGFLTPVWGGHPGGGGYLDNLGYYFAFNDYVDLTLMTRIYEFREFVANAASSYKLKYRLDGSLSARYKLDTDFNRQQREWALNYSHNQNITPDGKTRLSGTGNLISRKDFYQQFSEDSIEMKEQKLLANLSFSRQFDPINGRMNLYWRREHNLSTDIVSQDLPKLSFSLPSRPLIPQKKEDPQDSLKWFNNIVWGYKADGIVKHEKYTGDGNVDTVGESFHPAMRQEFSCRAPFDLLRHIKVTPNFSGRLSTFYGYYDPEVKRYDTLSDTISYVVRDLEDDDRHSDYTLLKYDTLSYNQQARPDSIRVTRYQNRVVPVRDTFPDAISNVRRWNTGVGLSTTLYGHFPLRLFTLDGLRHTLRPSVSYTFTPERNLEKQFFNVGFSESEQKRSQKINFSVSNDFHARIVKKKKEEEEPEKKTLPLLSFKLGTGYDFEAESRKWSNLTAGANTAIKNISFNPSANFWLYDENDNISAPILQRFSLDLRLGSLAAKGAFWGGDLLVLDSLQPDDPVKYSNVKKTGWNVSLAPSYSFSISRSSPTEIFVPKKQYGLRSSATINITRNWALQWSSTYNFQADQWVQNSIHLSCDLECWDMRFQWRPEKLNPGYYFIIHIKKLPEIKWEQRR